MLIIIKLSFMISILMMNLIFNEKFDMQDMINFGINVRSGTLGISSFTFGSSSLLDIR